MALMFASAVEAIQRRGGAQIGDKTLLDAFIPASLSLQESANEGLSMQAAFEIARQKAEEGAEATKTMVASKGRASYVGERSLSHPDAGATAVSVIFKALV